MIGIEVKGIKQLDKYLSDFQKNKLKNFKKVGLIGVRDIQNHFRYSQGQDSKWQSLKSRKGKPLQKTGALQQSISENIHSDDTVEVGTNLKYARIHNFGGTIKPVRKKYLMFKIGDSYIRTKQSVIPQREFMWISADADTKITELLFASWEQL